MTARQLTGDDLGMRVRIRESETHMLGGMTGILIAWLPKPPWNKLPDLVKVKLDDTSSFYFVGTPEEIEPWRAI